MSGGKQIQNAGYCQKAVLIAVIIEGLGALSFFIKPLNLNNSH
jgi:hypothetical protein